ncbi:epoxide hydrolase family protein [Novosphingobium sp. ST904]|uniref:epoxide hydrolase family protein n=1 Tax=Novosphingobium sp. ST904 TaxID=1684385 RepID=UPI000B22F16E|nr:epoxide hydrolase [Novosphingobium sp. ST904]
MDVTPFEFRASDDALADLRARLERTRFAADFANEDWRYGFNGDYLRELVAYWLDGYDWRTQENAINAWPQFKTEMDGVPIHFIHVKGKGPNPTPLILTHGWPWTFWDYRELIGPLTDPAAYGGDPADAFHLVIPSLPGYVFSTPLTTPGHNFWTTADLWVKLMDGLGYPRFASHGEDWGAFLTAQLGHKYPDRMIGVHFTTMFPLDMFGGGRSSRFGARAKRAGNRRISTSSQRSRDIMRCRQPSPRRSHSRCRTRRRDSAPGSSRSAGHGAIHAAISKAAFPRTIC